MTKWKAPYYKFWKQMRTQHNRVRKMLENSQMPRDAATAIGGWHWMTEEMRETALDFNGWMLERSPETLGADVIQARNMYVADRTATPILTRSLG
ncbi:hypothetical protein D3C71_1749900 [compost metagenome]